MRHEDPERQAMCEAMRDAFLKEQGNPRMVFHGSCVAKLWGRRCTHNYSYEYCTVDKKGRPHLPPGCDHPAMLYTRERGYYAFIYQPYGLSPATLAEINEMCSRLNLHAEISHERSWHSPGLTVLVILTREEEPCG